MLHLTTLNLKQAIQWQSEILTTCEGGHLKACISWSRWDTERWTWHPDNISECWFHLSLCFLHHVEIVTLTWERTVKAMSGPQHEQDTKRHLWSVFCFSERGRTTLTHTASQNTSRDPCQSTAWKCWAAPTSTSEQSQAINWNGLPSGLNRD